MAQNWLNVFVDQTGVSPASQWVKASDVVQIGGRTVRLFESDRGGSVVTTQGGISSYGDAEVYLKINFPNGGFSYLSAPLHTTVDVSNVASLELNLLYLVGPTGASYRALVNAHCVYDIL